MNRRAAALLAALVMLLALSWSRDAVAHAIGASNGDLLVPVLISLFRQLSPHPGGRIVGGRLSRRPSFGPGRSRRLFIGKDVGQAQMERPSRCRRGQALFELCGTCFKGHGDLRTNPRHPTTGGVVPYIVYRLSIVQTLAIPPTLRVGRDLRGKSNQSPATILSHGFKMDESRIKSDE